MNGVITHTEQRSMNGVITHAEQWSNEWCDHSYGAVEY